MLTFKKNWLYKYNEWCTGNWATRYNVHKSNTLCDYFWGSIWNLVVVNIWYIFLFHIIGMAFSIPLLASGVLDKFFILKGFSGLYISIGFGYLSAALVVGVSMTYTFLIEPFLQKRKSKKEKVESKPSVAVEYAKAVKSKVCPLIKFED